MDDKAARELIDTLREHGNQIGSNLAFFKTFLAAQQREEHDFLAEQRQASDRAQRSANRAAIASAVAAFFAAMAAGVQAYAALRPVASDRYESAPNSAGHGVYILDKQTGELRLCMTGQTKGPGTIGIACMSPSQPLAVGSK